MAAQESKSINFRVSEVEKEHFERLARQLDDSLTNLFRYELNDHFFGIEREGLLKELKTNSTRENSQGKDEVRADLLKKLFLNISQSLRWYRNKIKNHQRQINRLEQMQQGYEQFEQRLQSLLEE